MFGFNNYKKGAMFGLDARIALAIFGALSVISGAALYSAIQDSKATALITDMNEVGKAWDAYILDTGKDIPVEADNATRRHRITAELAKSSAKGWKGPYLSYDIDTTNTDRLASLYGGNWSLVSVSSDDWGLGHPTQPTWKICDDIDDKCHTSVQLSSTGANILNFSLATAIDKKIDDSDGAYSGNFRWYESAGYNVFALIYAPHKMPQ